VSNHESTRDAAVAGSNAAANDTADGQTAPPATPFHDLDAYLALPRGGGLTLSRDGSRLVTSVSTLDPESTGYRTALWEVDPTGTEPARRLTRGAKGESGAVFTSDGDLLFTAARPDPTAKASDDPPAALWRLAASGGEAELIATRKAGVGGIRTARDAAVLVLSSGVMPGAADDEQDEKIRTARKDNKVEAILHTGYPIRYWDSDLGPDQPHLFTADLSGLTAETAGADPRRLDLADVLPQPGNALREADYGLSPDGRFVVSSIQVPQAKGSQRSEIVLLDRAGGDRRVLATDPSDSFFAPVFSPDGSRVAYARESISTPEVAPRITIEVVEVAGGVGSRVAREWDRWPAGLAWLPDSTGLLINADENGRSPVFHLDLATDIVSRITDADATFTDLQVAPDGSAVYALQVSYAAPARPVRIGLGATDRGVVTALRGPSPDPLLPGTLTEVSTDLDDGVTVRGWLALPEGAGPDQPAPLLLWIHGGPLNSWNAWSWRWNPWLLVAAGYAVLLPDPALSTGYGQDFVQCGWGNWGGAPYTDLMAITDSVEARPDIDASRTAAMGGSFGGYMANWVAGHTDRFKAIVTHASLWALDQFGPTTDAAFYWAREMSPEMGAANSPHNFVEQIVTPMLVVHGDKDYRVPIGEGLRLWYELLSKSQLALDENGLTPHRLLYFPNENHWVLSPQHAKVWYQVVQGFLAEHVLGTEPPALPEVLG